MEIEMKFARLAIIASLLVGPALLPNLAQAKSPKWACVALDPANPFHFTCSLVNRP
jgi:hypothetical protein